MKLLHALNNGCFDTHFLSFAAKSQIPRTSFPKPLPPCASSLDLQGQSVAVIGLGKSGRSAVKLALARGASVVAIDQNQNLGLLQEDPIFETRNGCLKTVLGQFNEVLLEGIDKVVVSPGVGLEKYGLSDSKYSRKVVSELDFAAEILPKSTKILAVTGTNGKSTTVTFAGQMLSLLGYDTFVGGNLGTPLSEAAFQCLTSTSSRNKFQVAVVEVSSFQLEIPHKNFCPSVSVVLNLTPDHLDRHGTMSTYAMTKCRIFSLMKDEKLAILPLGNQLLDDAIGQYRNDVNLAWIGTSPGVKIDMEEKIASLEVPGLGIDSQLKLDAMESIGTHNYYNAAVAALSVLGLLVGVDIEAIGSTIDQLRVPLHRMQIVHTDCNGITWVNDSKATNVEATCAGLMGLQGKTAVILLGGRAKVLEGETDGFEQLVEPLSNHRCVITFGEAGETIHRALTNNGIKIPCIRATSMIDAVSRARIEAKHGDAIVLTPACLSFDEFKNFEHRGMVFHELSLSQ